MFHTKKIAVVGATGNVGQTLLHLLEAENFPATQLTLLASARSAGKQIMYAGVPLTVQDVAHSDFSQWDCAFFSAGSEIAKHYAPVAAAAGCYVIDKSSFYRLQETIPLIVPEVNGALLKNYAGKIISVPNCSTIQLVMALKPLHDLAGVARVEVASYQAVSGAGKKGNEQLRQELNIDNQNALLISNAENKIPIAFNVVPVIDTVLHTGFTKEEMKLHEETQKILASNVVVNATAVRVPVWQGHSEAVHITTHEPLSLEQAAQALQNFPGIHFCSEEIPTAATHAVQHRGVWVGRLRRHPSDSACHMNFWVVADNLYKGAAWNALQTAQCLFNRS